MVIEYQEEYGADADGNRGQTIWEYELEPFDREEVEEQLLEQLADLEEDEDWPDTLTVEFISHYTEEPIYFEVTVSDYLTKPEEVE